MARKQKSLPGMERKTIAEIDAAAEAYVEARDKRMAATEDEVTAKEALITCMKENKVKVYKDTETQPPLVVTLTAGKDNVKVKEADEDEDAEATDDERDKAKQNAKQELSAHLRRQKERKGRAAEPAVEDERKLAED